MNRSHHATHARPCLLVCSTAPAPVRECELQGAGVRFMYARRTGEAVHNLAPAVIVRPLFVIRACEDVTSRPSFCAPRHSSSLLTRAHARAVLRDSIWLTRSADIHTSTQPSVLPPCTPVSTLTAVTNVHPSAPLSSYSTMAASASATASALATSSAVVLHADLPSDMVNAAVSATETALAAHKVEKDAAQAVKKAMEGYYGGLWHCVVGTSFGLSVSHENNSLLLFRVGKTHVLLFQTFDESSLVRKDGGAPRAARGVPRETKKDDEDDDA